MIYNFRTFIKKSPNPSGCMEELNKTFKEELIPVLYNLFQKYRKEHFPVHFKKLVLPWYQNQTDKSHTHTKLYTKSPHEHRCQNP